MAKRKPISKKKRFEVFKRDHFTCQYCGRSAPDVVLEVDHIKPVVEGGTNNVLNLITSCKDCNRGKGKIRLTDNQEMKKQSEQLNLLAERKEQLEMMTKWREELLAIEDDEAQSISDYFNTITGFYIIGDGLMQVKKWIKTYGLSEVYEATDIAVYKYYENSESTAKKALDKIGGVLYNRKFGRTSDYYWGKR